MTKTKPILEKEASIIFNKTQYTVRIPIKIAEALNLKGKEKMVFGLYVEEGKPALKVKVKRK